MKQIKNIVIISSVLLLFFSGILCAEEKVMRYNILQNGALIGQMQFYKNDSGEDLYLKMTSHAKSRFIIDILVDTEESAHFNNGRLISSGILRQVNGKQKVNKQTQFINNSYQLRSDNKTRWIKGAINCNLLLLYISEPSALSQVYSDNYQELLDIRQIKSHTYRILLPDGNYNDYSFDNGVCKEVVIHHSMYTISMQLV